jgi:hypothetical protein
MEHDMKRQKIWNLFFVYSSGYVVSPSTSKSASSFALERTKDMRISTNNCLIVSLAHSFLDTLIFQCIFVNLLIRNGKVLRITLRKISVVGLVNLCLIGQAHSNPMFALSFFEIPKGVRTIFDYYRSRFLRQSGEHKCKCLLARWDVICRPKDHGGLGVEDLEIKNKCLLRKWYTRYLLRRGFGNCLGISTVHSNTISEVEAKPTD